MSQPPLPYRFRAGLDPGIPPIVLLHGLGGDQHVMWELTASLPRGGLLAAPRAPYAQPSGGYGWLPQLGEWPPNREEFTDSIRILEDFLAYLERVHQLARDRLILMGFSQGAAMAFAATMTSAGGLSTRPAGLVAGAGHLPQGDLRGLAGLPVFWGHGVRDELIPVSVARSDVDRLRAVGAEVHYCEADAGHKLGLACLRELRKWITERLGQPSRDQVA